jgi:hypothetical protein
LCKEEASTIDAVRRKKKLVLGVKGRTERMRENVIINGKQFIKNMEED